MTEDALARYVMIGGFLGAGKSTASLHIARHFRDAGRRVGLITNDQSHGLVDTKLAGSRGFPVEEITGGCFCCRFDSLTQAAERLTAEARPDVFLAEPVGSCTDLKATVDYPLRRLYGDAFRVAPLSVMVDPVRALRVLGLEEGKSFSPKVVYVYLKQLEEADIILVNKIDLVSVARLASLRAAIAERYPGARLLEVSARNGDGMREWIGALDAEDGAARAAMEIDYDLYADGEALLGWLNLTAAIASPTELDGNRLLRTLASRVAATLAEGSAEIAHFKMTLSPDEGSDLGVANVVRGDVEPELSHELAEPIDVGELIVNLRAEAAPELLRSTVLAQLDALAVESGLDVRIEHVESFRPDRPRPTYRLPEMSSRVLERP